jgi:hypothetical protein
VGKIPDVTGFLFWQPWEEGVTASYWNGVGEARGPLLPIALVTIHTAIGPNRAKNLECRCTRCKDNNSGNCGYQGRVVVNSNGECAVMEEGLGGPDGSFGQVDS